jgi:SAM-dependent methyltransferase
VTYTTQFYEDQRGGSRRSARCAVPVLVDLLRPRSVVDVGCGVGAWLAVFVEQGVADAWGIDGAWVEEALLEIPTSRFIRRDLTRPLDIGRTFDVVVSLEVAEHLPPAAADTFVDSLVRLGPVVVFSAAIPFQGGTHHVNEQWPDYWAEKFEQRGFAVVDALRPRLWQVPDLEPYYAQNMLLYVDRAHLARCERLERERAATERSPLAVVHPATYLEKVEYARRLVGAIEDVAATVPPGSLIVQVDGAQCGPVLAAGRPALPFLEKGGQYWGPPADDTTAIAELERLRGEGARFVVVAWPAFWWLDHYAAFHRHLRTTSRAVCENDRVVIFDLGG